MTIMLAIVNQVLYRFFFNNLYKTSETYPQSLTM